jgi:hypothetical protein
MAKVIQDYHEDPAQGYPGVVKTLELIQRTYTALKIRRYIEQFIKECVPCQQNKALRYV